MPYFRPKTLSPSATYRPLPSLAIYRDAAVLSMPSIAVLCRSSKEMPTCPASSSGKRCVRVAWTPIDSMTALSEADIGRGISSCRCCVRAAVTRSWRPSRATAPWVGSEPEEASALPLYPLQAPRGPPDRRSRAWPVRPHLPDRRRA